VGLSITSKRHDRMLVTFILQLLLLVHEHSEGTACKNLTMMIIVESRKMGASPQVLHDCLGWVPCPLLCHQS
jgi:hypothetical protein